MWRALAAVTRRAGGRTSTPTRATSTPHFVTGLVGPLIDRRGAALREGRLPAPVRGRRRGAARRRRPREPAHGPAAAGGVLPRAGRPDASRWPARWPPRGSCWSRSRSPPATRWRWRCCSTCTTRWAPARSRRCDLGERRNHHQPLDALRPMADTVLAAVCERLRREGRLMPTDPHRRSSSGRRSRRCARRLMALRCVYTDLDGTLRGRGRVAVPRRRGRLHPAARARAGGVPPGRGGGGAEVRPAQGSGDGGRAADRPERLHLRGRLGPGDRRRGAAAVRRVRAARRPDAARADRRDRRARRCWSASSTSSRTRHGTWTASSRTSTAAWPTWPPPTRCSSARGTAACGWSTTAPRRRAGTPTT